MVQVISSPSPTAFHPELLSKEHLQNSITELAACITVAAVVLESGVNISAETLLSKWHGEKTDMGMAIKGLLLAEERQRLFE